GSLATFDDDSLHFVIACHLLEHCEDPLGALGHWLRVLKREGILFLAVPDRRFTFDRRRPNTTFEHLLRDALEGPEASRLQHYLEWVERVEGLPEGDRLDRVQELVETRYSIHFHVWDAASLKELFTRWMADAETPAELVRVCRNRSENLAILRKTGP
ncbi:MAG: methyltransferase domain-containing protein, partial [Acidobacteria bacterium]|nr:methyltransferase domain-containing protein [Acidobacteriota bacterium]